MQTQPNQTTPAGAPAEDTPHPPRRLAKLFGFRSNKPGKKLLATVYYLLALGFLVIGLVTPPLVPAGAWDTAVFKLTILLFAAGMLTPAILLSNTALRQRLPFFRDYRWMRSLVGLLIVFVVLMYLYTWMDTWHTPEYRAAMDSYMQQVYGFS